MKYCFLQQLQQAYYNNHHDKGKLQYLHPALLILILAKCRRLASVGKGLGLVVIDYLQLISGGPGYGNNRQQEVSDISRSLKAALVAIFKAKAVLPIAGRAAIIINSCGWSPLVILSKS